MDRGRWEARIDAAAAAGQRVLALASRTVPAGHRRGGRLPAAGLRIQMITGDHAGTAAVIGRQLGLHADVVLTGATVQRLSDADRRRQALACAIVARASPEHKLRLVRALLFILTTSGGEAGVILIAVFAGLTLPVTAGQVLWVNLVTAATLALAFELAEADVMRRPPRLPSEPLVTRLQGLRIAWVSALMMAVTFAAFQWALSRGSSTGTARTAAVNMLVGSGLVYLFTVRRFTASDFSRSVASPSWRCATSGSSMNKGRLHGPGGGWPGGGISCWPPRPVPLPARPGPPPLRVPSRVSSRVSP